MEAAPDYALLRDRAKLYKKLQARNRLSDLPDAGAALAADSQRFEAMRQEYADLESTKRKNNQERKRKAQSQATTESAGVKKSKLDVEVKPLAPIEQLLQEMEDEERRALDDEEDLGAAVVRVQSSMTTVPPSNSSESKESNDGVMESVDSAEAKSSVMTASTVNEPSAAPTSSYSQAVASLTLSDDKHLAELNRRARRLAAHLSFVKHQQRMIVDTPAQSIVPLQLESSIGKPPSASLHCPLPDALVTALNRVGIQGLFPAQVAMINLMRTLSQSSRVWQSANQFHQHSDASSAHNDVLLRAPTGSGKTLAVLLPIITQLISDRHRASCAAGSTPDTSSINVTILGVRPRLRCLWIAPTTELASQTYRVLLPLLDALPLQCSLLSSATPIADDLAGVGITLPSITKSTPPSLAQFIAAALAATSNHATLDFDTQSDVIITTLHKWHTMSQLLLAAERNLLSVTLQSLQYFVLDEIDQMTRLCAPPHSLSLSHTASLYRLFALTSPLHDQRPLTIRHTEALTLCYIVTHASMATVALPLACSC